MNHEVAGMPNRPNVDRRLLSPLTFGITPTLCHFHFGMLIPPVQSGTCRKTFEMAVCHWYRWIGNKNIRLRLRTKLQCTDCVQATEHITGLWENTITDGEKNTIYPHPPVYWMNKPVIIAKSLSGLLTVLLKSIGNNNTNTCFGIAETILIPWPFCF